MAKQGLAARVGRSGPETVRRRCRRFRGRPKRPKPQPAPSSPEPPAPQQKVYHSTPHGDRPISAAHGIIDTDLARDNLENDIPAADLQDL